MEAAIEDYDRAIQAAPDDVELRYARGLLRKRLGRHDEAVEDYEVFRRVLAESER